MLTIRRFLQVSVFNARQQSYRNSFSTVSNSENNVTTGSKPYPLEGIRVLDLTRIGNWIYTYVFDIYEN